MNEPMRIKHFFAVLHEKRQAFAKNYAYFAPQLAPRFNCFQFIQADELLLSEILCALLNPRGNHAQGELFLQLFFAQLERDYPLAYSGDIDVKPEVSTDRLENTARRIDIVVSFGNQFGLAIENKPWAKDQHRQLSDYAQQMSKRFDKDWCLVYLSGRDTDPSEHSASREEIALWEENDQYRKISFAEIVAWLKNCEAQCQADHVRHFLRDFIAYCKNKFLGETDMVDAQLLKDFALEGTNNLEIALALEKQIVPIKEALLKKFLVDLETEFKAQAEFNEWIFSFKPDFSYWNKYSRAEFHKSAWKNYVLAIEFRAKECQGLIVGIKNTREDVTHLSETELSELNEQLGKGLQSPMWSWYLKFPEPYYDWWKNHEPWLTVQSGDMAKLVIKEIAELAKAAEAIIDEAEGVV